MGDNFPEIIAKSLDQKTLYVFDRKGNVKLAIATNSDEELISIERYNDLHSIFTKSSIYSFDAFQNSNGNQWTMEHGNIAKTRKLDLNYNFISDGTLLKNAYCYPNPIRENIGVIRVEMVASSKVEITIFDLAGYFIDSFKSDINTIGHQLKEWNWSTKDINPGVYFAHISASNDKKIEHKIIKIAVIH